MKIVSQVQAEDPLDMILFSFPKNVKDYLSTKDFPVDPAFPTWEFNNANGYFYNPEAGNPSDLDDEDKYLFKGALKQEDIMPLRMWPSEIIKNDATIEAYKSGIVLADYTEHQKASSPAVKKKNQKPKRQRDEENEGSEDYEGESGGEEEELQVETRQTTRLLN